MVLWARVRSQQSWGVTPERLHQLPPPRCRIRRPLVRRAGRPLGAERRCLWTSRRSKSGADFAAVILEQVRGAGAVLVVVSAGWSVATDAEGRRRLNDPEDFVRRELEAAWTRGTKIIPVLVQEAHMPAPGDLPDSIAPFAHRQAAVLTDRRWRAEVKELIDHLAGATPAPTPPGAPLEGGDRPTTAGRSVTRYRTRFVGRAEDIDGIQQLLTRTGSATIVGPGGVGKSRLAVEIARAKGPDYRDGVALAELAVVEDPSLVVGVVATAVGASDFDREATLDGVASCLIGEVSVMRPGIGLDRGFSVVSGDGLVAEPL